MDTDSGIILIIQVQLQRLSQILLPQFLPMYNLHKKQLIYPKIQLIQQKMMKKVLQLTIWMSLKLLLWSLAW